METKRKKIPTPPKLPAWIIRKIAWSEDRLSIQENLHEEYIYVSETKGAKSADLWYWGHLIRSIFPFLKFSTYWRFTMFRNYIKTVLRNMNKYRGYSFINIAGLAVGLTCFILISIWINFEISYDKFHENSENLYQVIGENRLPNGDKHFFSTTPAALANALKTERPEIINISRSVEWLKFLIGTKNNRFMERVRFVDSAFLEMFSLDFIEGNPKTALNQPHSIVLTENIAEKHFPGQKALGQEILFGTDGNFLVTGVIKEFPSYSSLSSLCLLPITALTDQGWDINEWTSGNYQAYIHLKKETDLEFFKSQIRDIYERYAENWAETKLTVKPFTKIHLYHLNGGGPIVYVYIFSGLSLFVLLLAIVNFMNLSTTRSTLRAKEIGIRKTAGAFRQQVTIQILIESIVIVLFSGILAVVMAYFFLPVLNHLTGARISFSFNREMALFLMGIIFFTGIISGLYPAFILSSMDPVRAIKGALKPGKNSLLFRRVLIAFQFSLSIFMIIAMIGVNKQLRFLQNKELGYNQSNVISMGLDQEVSRNYSAIRTEFMQNPDILTMTRSSSTMETKSTTTGGDAVTWEGQSSDIVMPQTCLMRTDPEFIETFQIDMLEGRFFSNEFPNDLTDSAVINETALRTIDLESPLGKRLTVWGRNFRIIGVIKDFHFYSLHNKIQPLIFIHRYAGFSQIFIRINSQNTLETLSFIHKKLKEIVPGYIPEIKFLDESLNSVYLSEQRMAAAIRYLTFLAIIISCIGLLGLASFSIRQRTKEIAVRKILGATEGNIILKLSREILICIAAANIAACPIAYFMLQKWLQNYPYHTTLGIGIFILASLVALVLAFLSVSWNVLKASLANPADSLRFE